MKHLAGTPGAVCVGVALAAVLLAGCDGETADGKPAGDRGTDPGSVSVAPSPTLPSAPSVTPSPNPPAVPSPAPPRRPSAPPAPEAPRTGPLVVVTRSGGFAGRVDSVTVSTDGTYTTLSTGRAPGTARMRPAELAALRRALADIERLPPVPSGHPTPDAYLYTVSHGGHQVTMDETEPVAAIQRVVAAVPLPS